MVNIIVDVPVSDGQERTTRCSVSVTSVKARFNTQEFDNFAPEFVAEFIIRMCFTNKMVQFHMSSVTQASKEHLMTPVTCQRNKEMCAGIWHHFTVGSPRKSKILWSSLGGNSITWDYFMLKTMAYQRTCLELGRCFFQLPLEEKITRYPPRPKDRGEVMYGVGPHSDTRYLSLLLQDNVGGLRAKLADENWVDVQPKRGTFVVNLSEMLQIATQGYFRATVHRVITLSTDSSRYSVPFFFNPCLDAEIKPIDCTAVLRTEASIHSKEWPEVSNCFLNALLPSGCLKITLAI